MVYMTEKKPILKSAAKTTPKHVALLRGINVGGNNKVDMKKLKATFESLKLSDVRTYINSGNVIFSSAEKDCEKLAKKIEKGIAKDFRFKIPVVVVSDVSIKKIVSAAKKEWTNEGDKKTDVMFLWKEVDRPTVVKELKAVKGIDTVKYVSGAILWHISRANFNKSAMRNLIGSKLYKQMTVRNVNTLRKLHELMK